MTYETGQALTNPTVTEGSIKSGNYTDTHIKNDTYLIFNDSGGSPSNRYKLDLIFDGVSPADQWEDYEQIDQNLMLLITIVLEARDTISTDNYYVLMWNFDTSQWIEVESVMSIGAIKTEFTRQMSINCASYLNDNNEFKLRIANGKALGKGGAPNNDGQLEIDYLMIGINNSSEGPLSPGTMADDGTVGTVAWSNPDNAKTSNNTRATALLASNVISHYLKATNFSFSIPEGATIDGIVVEIERQQGGGDFVALIEDQEVKIVKADASIGAENKADTATTWPGSDTIATYGANNDLWSETWAAANINDSDFGVVLAAEQQAGGFPGATSEARVDHIQITVHYTEVTGTNTQINIADAWKESPEWQINIGDVWKTVAGIQINIADAWKTIF